MAGKQLGRARRAACVAAGWPADAPALRRLARRLARPARQRPRDRHARRRAAVLHAGRPTVVTVGAGAAPLTARDDAERCLRPVGRPTAGSAARRRRRKIALDRLPCRAGAVAIATRASSMTHVVTRIVHPLQVHRLRRRVPGRLLPRRPELPDDRPRRVHRLRRLHPRVPGQRDLPEEDVPGDQQHMIQLNAELSRRAGRASPSASRRCPTPTSGRTDRQARPS